MRTIVVCVIILAACEKSASTPTPRAETQPAIGSVSAPSGAQRVDEDQLFADVMQLTERMASTVLADDGDCDGLAKKLLTLQPLAASIFSRSTDLRAASTPADLLRLGTRFNGIKPAFEKADPQRAQALDKKTSELSVTCAGNPALEQALRQLGLKMWKPAAPAQPDARH